MPSKRLQDAPRCSPRAAFTITELLVVIAIIAVLISILLPALGKARMISRRTTSAANLASLARVQVAYGTEFKDSFVNPFHASTPSLYPGLMTFSGPVSFATTILPQTSQTNNPKGLTFGDSMRTTEPFSHTWGSFMSHYLDGSDQGQAYLRDPSDPLLAIHAADLRASAISSDEYLFDTSYWYPPTFWLQPDRYRSELFQPIGPQAAECRWLARNTFGMVDRPSHKVLLFERFDWARNVRANGASTATGPPQWNNPSSRPQVAFVDGSVCMVRMSDLHALGESTEPAVKAIYQPSGLFDPPASYSFPWLLGPLTNPATQTPYETGAAPFDGSTPWRQYFYATRNGVRGMDVQKR